MVKLPPNLTVRPPNLDDIQTVYGLILACDIAVYGEPDSAVGDLKDEWSSIHLERDAWLVYDADKLIGYAAVFAEGHHFVFDFFTDPDYAVDELATYLLDLCEAHVREMLSVEKIKTPGKARVIVPSVSDMKVQIVQGAGYKIHKYYFRMQIELVKPPVIPSWPKNFFIRPMLAGEDDQLVYDFVRTAFQHPGRIFPSFDRWQGYMMRADHFNPDIWFLLFKGDELIGVALCYDYPEYGWVRQLGVVQSLRRKGIGSAMLRHVFGIFYNRGHKKVALGVDSERPDACRLYENMGMQRVRQYDEYEKLIEVRENG